MGSDPFHFDAAWLALREPVDHRSRPAALLPLLATAWRTHLWSQVLDLGSGTGSNLRYLGSRLPGGQDWTLVDHDRDLLNHPVGAGTPEPVRSVRRVHGRLADHGLAGVARAHLVTGSALLDLVSKDWLTRLVEACRSAGCGAHFALTYDGEIQWLEGAGHGGTGDPDLDPNDAQDDELLRLSVNAHQRGDKGLGPALGPTASGVADALFRAAGYRTWLLASPWRLGPEDGPLARALVDGWERAALELEVDGDPDRAHRIQAWAVRRRQTIDRGAFKLSVGHQDLLALPADPHPGDQKFPLPKGEGQEKFPLPLGEGKNG